MWICRRGKAFFVLGILCFLTLCCAFKVGPCSKCNLCFILTFTATVTVGSRKADTWGGRGVRFSPEIQERNTGFKLHSIYSSNICQTPHCNIFLKSRTAFRGGNERARSPISNVGRFHLSLPGVLPKRAGGAPAFVERLFDRMHHTQRTHKPCCSSSA